MLITPSRREEKKKRSVGGCDEQAEAFTNDLPNEATDEGQNDAREKEVARPESWQGAQTRREED